MVGTTTSRTTAIPGTRKWQKAQVRKMQLDTRHNGLNQIIESMFFPCKSRVSGNQYSSYNLDTNYYAYFLSEPKFLYSIGNHEL